MKLKITTKRWQLLSYLLFVILLVGGAVIFKLSNDNFLAALENQRLENLVSLQQDYNSALEQDIVLDNLLNQDVDTYLANLDYQLDLLNSHIDLLTYQHQLSLDTEEKEQFEQEIEELKTELDRYLLDKAFMDYASADWLEVQSQPEVKEALTSELKQQAEDAWPEPEADGEMYIKAGQLIGAQGCTGVCTGTHLHFVVLKDRIEKNACKLMPLKQLSRWGVAESCGVEGEAELEWPMPTTWILTQVFGNRSQVTGTKHLGVDLIDYDGAPVYAAHDGYYYSLRRSCTGASICNTGAARIAFVCEVKGCETGLVTEYWHLSWYVKGPNSSKDVPISEFDDVY